LAFAILTFHADRWANILISLENTEMRISAYHSLQEGNCFLQVRRQEEFALERNICILNR
jgi:hypothetical protein